MSEDMTPRLALPVLAAGQAQKEITHNEALQRLDMLVQPVVQSAALAAPPGTPAEGQCWLVASPAADAWSGHEQCLAQWTAGGWRFAVPLAGWQAHVLDVDETRRFDGAAWLRPAVRPDGIYFADVRVISARQPAIAAPTGGVTIDTEARAVLAQVLTSLRNHGLVEV
jgi:hypothetical protein